jgi:hypothetical protein
MEEQQNDGLYRTLDMVLAAYCKTIGYEIVDIEAKRIKGKAFKRATICIKSSDGLKEAIDAYFDNRGQVDPMAFYNNVRALKSRIMNECKDGG